MARKAALYRSLRYRNLNTELKHHLILHYEFAKKSRLAEDVLELVVVDAGSLGELALRKGDHVAVSKFLMHGCTSSRS